MAGKSGAGGRFSGKSSSGLPSSVVIPKVESFNVTATVGSDVSVTLTHDLDAENYVVQIIDSSKNNIVLPLTRNTNDVVFYFGDVTIEAIYTIIIIH